MKLLFLLYVIFNNILILFAQNAPTAQPPDYFIIVDAGSSHTQSYIYSYQQREGDTSIAPFSSLKKVKTQYYNISMSDYQNKTNKIGVDLIQPIIDQCTDELSQLRGAFDTVPFHIAATAGMRLVPEPNRSKLISTIQAYLQSHSPFGDNKVKILSGEEEGIFGWVCVNYLNKYFGAGNVVGDSVGALDLGGESTQIAFVPPINTSILAGASPIFIDSQSIDIYSHSFLQYGINGIRDREQELTWASKKDPCLNIGYWFVANETINVTGTSNYTECVNNLEQLFDFNSNLCYTGTDSCAFNGVFLPPVKYNTFFAFSTFSNLIDDLGLGSQTTLAVLKSKGEEICGYTKEELLKKYSSKYVETFCIDTAYAVTLLSKGYKFDLNATSIYWVPKNQINNVDVDWSLGYAVYYVNQKGWRTPSCKEKNTALIILGLMLGIVSLLFVGLIILYHRKVSQIHPNNHNNIVMNHSDESPLLQN